MADDKKYYYMRLKDNFFESDAMVVLESVQDGYLYSNILLKLYLRSLKDDGRLMMNNKIPYNAQMIATITRHQVGTVEKALKIFTDMDLIEILDNGAMYMVDIQNFIGKGSSEADRIRAYQRRIAIEKKTGVEIYEKSTPEIEIELELEKELETEIEAAARAREGVPGGTQQPPSHDDSVLKFYQDNIGKPNQFVRNKIAEYRKLGCADDLIVYAFNKMAEANATSIGYIVPVLNDAIALGTLDAESFAKAKGKGYAGRNMPITRSTQTMSWPTNMDRRRRLKRRD